MATLPIRTIQQRRFDGGMLTDPREPSANKFRYGVNFDCLTNPFKLTPYHDSENGDSASATSMKQNFCIAYLTASSTYRLFSLGVKSGVGTAEVLYKDLDTNGGSDLSNASWSSPANNQSSSGTTSFNLFTPYKTTGKIYGAAGGNEIWSFTPDGSTVWNDTEHSLSYTNISNGIVHPTKDILYIGYDNKITQNNNGSWSDSILVLPDSLYVTQLAEYGDYLAILAAPLSGIGSSKLFLWDLNATTWNTVVDCGEGIGKVLYSLDGTLITISIASDATRLQSRVVFREYTTAGMEPFATLQGAVGDTLLSQSQRIDNRLLFMMTMTQEGSTRAGVWSVAKNANGFAITQEYSNNNNVAFNTSDVLGGFIKVGDYVFQSFTVSSAWTLSKTNDQPSYTATSIFESGINPEMPDVDKIQKKQLVSVGAMYEALPSNGQVVLKYRVDNSSGAWTTIFTETKDGVVYTEPFTNANGTPFTAGKEYEFHIESTGGAEITGLHYKYEILTTNV